MALQLVQRPSYQLTDTDEDSAECTPSRAGRITHPASARHARKGSSSLLLKG